MSQTTQTPWPEGVIARYLTVGGATVDIARSNDPADDSATQWDSTSADCIGCGEKEIRGWSTRPYGELIELEYAERMATKDAHTWAQQHAHACRAMPRPTA